MIKKNINRVRSQFKDYNTPLRHPSEFKNGIWGLKTRNKEQMFALNLLMDNQKKKN